MPAWGPVSRRVLIATLRRFGFVGPFSGGRHEFMIRGELALTIPNLHGRDIGLGLLSRILKQAGISRRRWEQA